MSRLAPAAVVCAALLAACASPAFAAPAPGLGAPPPGDPVVLPLPMPEPPAVLAPAGLDPWRARAAEALAAAEAQTALDTRWEIARRDRARYVATHVPAEVSIAGVPVGGLSLYRAYTTVRSELARPLRVRLGRRTMVLDAASLGVRTFVKAAVLHARTAAPGTDVPVARDLRPGPLRTFVDRLAGDFDRVPQDATLSFRGEHPWLGGDRPGRALDRASARGLLSRALLAEGAVRPVSLPFRVLPSRVTRDGFGPVIVIRRGSNQLLLYDGMRLERTFGVATGQSVYPTPLGRYSIATMWRNPWWYPPSSDWAEGLKPVPPGPGNPLGTRWMGITSPGVGIHGTPDDASIGYSRSHGCVRMHISEAEWLFDHVHVGTPVYIVSA